jgi:hypothetical protein
MKYIALFMLLGIATSFTIQKSKPVIYLVGDSTVKNGSGKGESGLWGWGDFLYTQFDTTQVRIEN